jgi:hypothetical protein
MLLPARAAAFGLLLIALVGGAARAESDVDLALVLAVDVSFSMDPDEQALQRQGYVEAFQSPAVLQAIQRGPLGRIAVTYMEWASSTDQKVVVPWTIVADPESAFGFAEELAAKPTRRASLTSISGAIDFSVRLLAESGLTAGRRVIDVSGDGANNHGRPVAEARADALAQGISINGLPIMLKAPNGYWDIADLDLYYWDCVIGGPGAFMIPAREREQFRDAIKAKILREVADRGSPSALVQKAQASYGGDCMVGEKAVGRSRD